MEIFFNSFPVFFTFALALFFREKGLLPKGTKEAIGTVLFKIMIPALVFKVIYDIELGKEFVELAPYFALLIGVLLLGGFLLSKLLMHKADTTASVLMAMLAYSVGSFAYPFVVLNFDDQVFKNVVIVDITLFVSLMVLGPIISSIFSKKVKFSPVEIIKSIVTDVTLISFFTAAMLTIFKVQVPEFVLNTADFLSAGFFFLVIFYIAIAIRMPDLNKVKTLAAVLIFRTVLLILFAFVLLKKLGVDTVAQQAVVLALFTPFSAFPIVYTEKYDLDSEIITQLSVLSLLIGLVAYPFVIAIAQAL